MVSLELNGLAEGLRDVTSRYASRYLYSDVRRLRVDSEWLKATTKVKAPINSSF